MAAAPRPLLETRLPHQVDRLPELLDAIEALAAQFGWSDAFRHQVLLVVEELVVNAMSYGGRTPGDGWVSVCLIGEEDSLVIQIADNGREYDPFASAPEPSLDLDLDSRAIGGLGVHFVREMTDSREYRRIDGENHLRLTKRWAASPHGQ